MSPSDDVLHDHAVLSHIDPQTASIIGDHLTQMAAADATHAASLLDDQHHYRTGAAAAALHVPFPLKQTVASGTRRVPLEAFPELPPSARLISVCIYHLSITYICAL